MWCARWGTHLNIKRRQKGVKKVSKRCQKIPEHRKECYNMHLVGHYVTRCAKVLRFNALRFAAAFCPVLCGAPLPNGRSAPNLTEIGVGVVDGSPLVIEAIDSNQPRRTTTKKYHYHHPQRGNTRNLYFFCRLADI